MPISSPLSFGKLGVSVFADWGTAYEHGRTIRDQTDLSWLGAGGWLAFAGLGGVGVAHGRAPARASASAAALHVLTLHCRRRLRDLT